VHKKEHDLQARAKALQKRLAAFMSSKKGIEPRNNFRQPQGSPVTWEDVLQEIENSRVKWENKANGNIIRQQARNLGDRAKIARHWLDMLLGRDYRSFVCGGLKLLFGVGDSLRWTPRLLYDRNANQISR
jgi:hypothetical protein